VTILNVRHITVYRYSRPVWFRDHWLMLRPRDSHDLRLIQTNLNFSPPASVRWVHDVFGNSIAIASFTEPSAELRIESSLQLETYAVQRPASQITPEAWGGCSSAITLIRPIASAHGLAALYGATRPIRRRCWPI
jgi:transglutaminase-like putative cysteine protease